MVATMIRCRVSSPTAPIGRPSCVRLVDTVEYYRVID
jgi:hypothetical protein